MVRAVVPATTANLGPGYDCLGLALNLHNTLEMVPAENWKMVIHGEGAGTLPANKDSLVWQSMRRLWLETGTPAPVVEITMENQIPVGRGLGSSAAAIIGALVIANQWAGGPLNREELLQLAVELEGHPDNVTPALLGGLCLSVMEAEKAVALKLDFPASLRVVACIPDFCLATEKARAALPKLVPHKDAVFNLSRTALLVGALFQGRMDLLGLACRDKLHQDYRKALIPGFDIAVAAAQGAGALAAMLSGAGPTLLALTDCHGDGEGIGRAMVAAFAEAGIQARYEILTPQPQGARVIEQQHLR